MIFRHIRTLLKKRALVEARVFVTKQTLVDAREFVKARARVLSQTRVTLPGLLPAGLLAGLVCLTACGPAPIVSGINDPLETANRRTHDFNRKVDQKFLRKAGNSFVAGVPDPVVQGVGNVAGNLNTPGLIVNNVLQGDVEGAFVNSWRFVLNTTFGVLGLVDAATMLGLDEHTTDFGETMHVWGAEEGNYVELPFFGPSTERDTIGKVVDFFINPLLYVLPSPERFTGPVLSGVAKVGDRGRYSQLVDSVLYESADSYAQGRLTYLQNRRYKLGGDAAMDDPYGEVMGQETGLDYGDPYDELLSD